MDGYSCLHRTYSKRLLNYSACMMVVFTNIDSSLCTDQRRPAAGRAALCEGKQGF